MAGLTALIDADILVYKTGFAVEKKHYTLKWQDSGFHGVEKFVGKMAVNDWLKENEPEEYSWESELVVEPLSYCLSTVKHMISNVQKNTGAQKLLLFLSDKDNYRNDVATIAEYKGNRKQTRRPIYHREVMKYIEKHYEVVRVPRMEADDMLSEYQRTWNEAGKDTCIASIDKDLLQIPGKHYNLDSKKCIIVTPETALRNLYQQVLCGDRTDNIPGIKGIGAKTAVTILEDCTTEEEMYDECVTQWHEFLVENCDWCKPITGTGTVDITLFEYDDYNGEPQERTVHDIVHEIRRLLTVGIPRGDDHDEEEGNEEEGN